MCPSKLQTRNCCARLLVYFHQISKKKFTLALGWKVRLMLLSSDYVLADNRWRNVRLRHSVSWCSSEQVLIYCHEHCSQLMSREHPDIEILWAVMNGDRIATEDTNCEVSEKDPGLLEQFSACIQASVMSWTADRYINLLIQHFLSLEEAELRPANPREWIDVLDSVHTAADSK